MVDYPVDHFSWFHLLTLPFGIVQLSPERSLLRTTHLSKLLLPVSVFFFVIFCLFTLLFYCFLTSSKNLNGSAFLHERTPSLPSYHQLSLRWRRKLHGHCLGRYSTVVSRPRRLKLLSDTLELYFKIWRTWTSGFRGCYARVYCTCYSSTVKRELKLKRKIGHATLPLHERLSKSNWNARSAAVTPAISTLQVPLPAASAAIITRYPNIIPCQTLKTTNIQRRKHWHLATGLWPSLIRSIIRLQACSIIRVPTT